MRSTFSPIFLTAIFFFLPFFLAGQVDGPTDNGGGADKGKVERSERKDRLKEKMHVAQEKGDTESFEEYKDELQKLNDAGPYREEEVEMDRKDSLKQRMHEVKEAGESERYESLKDELQKMNDAGPYAAEERDKKETRKDTLKRRMHRAKEKGEMEAYERLKKELQELNGVVE